MDERHYGPRVILPRRIKADLVDGAIAATIRICPLLVGQGVAGIVPDSLLRLFVLGIPVGIGYSLFTVRRADLLPLTGTSDATRHRSRWSSASA